MPRIRLLPLALLLLGPACTCGAPSTTDSVDAGVDTVLVIAVTPDGGSGEQCLAAGERCRSVESACCSGLFCALEPGALRERCLAQPTIDVSPPGSGSTPVVEIAAVPAATRVSACDLSETIFTPHCAQCHNSASAVNLQPEALSTSLPRLVDAASPTDSLLLRKVVGTLEPGEGIAMPPNSPLDATLIDDLRTWVENGADLSCLDTRVLGDDCVRPTDCSSGRCENDRCANACGEEAADCFSDGDCCTGSCSIDFDSYGPGTCVPPLPDGAFCTWNTQCAGGGCLDNVCTSACGEIGAECTWSGIQCCEGTICLETGPYVPGECSAPLEPGAFCSVDFECASQACVDSTCAP